LIHAFSNTLKEIDAFISPKKKKKEEGKKERKKGMVSVYNEKKQEKPEGIRSRFKGVDEMLFELNFLKTRRKRKRSRQATTHLYLLCLPYLPS
jgi:hypothetical protein